jgi:protein-tyrosine phosphatase
VRGSERGDFDWWVAMDRSNAQDLRHLGLPGEEVLLLLDFAGSGTPDDVPDPYYEGGFDRTFSLVQAGCQGLLDHLLK